MRNPKAKLPKPKKRYTNFENLPLVLNVDDVAAVMRISRAGAYAVVRKDDFPRFKIGNRVLTAKSDFMQWFEQQKQ